METYGQKKRWKKGEEKGKGERERAGRGRKKGKKSLKEEFV